MSPETRKPENSRLLSLIILSTLGLWLGFPNDFVQLPFAALLWPCCAALLGMDARNWRQALKLGWLASIFGSCLALYWLSFPVHDVGGLHWIPALACAIIICAALSFQGGIFAAGAFFLRGLPLAALAVALFLLWYLLEWAFAVLGGFPWLPVAGSLAAWPLLVQGSALAGAWLWGSFWLCGAFFCAFGLRRPFSFRLVLAGALIFCVLAGYGAWRLHHDPLNPWPEGPDSLGALFVDGNIDQNQKWLPAFQRHSLETYINLTREGLEAAVREGIRQPLILWPETALPFFFETGAELARDTRECAIVSGCPLLFGAPGVERLPGSPEPAVFNRAFLLGPSGQTLGFYDKVHLVPFGEYVPDWLKLDFLEALLQGVGIYQEGDSAAPLRYGNLALGMLICYEGIFPWLAQERVEAGANILVDISNDGWFGESPAARQHLDLTVLRCIEQNRWLLRVANTGISAVADSAGRLVLLGPRHQAGYILGRARLESAGTFYHRIAVWLPPLALAVFCFFPVRVYILWRRKNCGAP